MTSWKIIVKDSEGKELEMVCDNDNGAGNFKVTKVNPSHNTKAFTPDELIELEKTIDRIEKINYTQLSCVLQTN